MRPCWRGDSGESEQPLANDTKHAVVGSLASLIGRLAATNRAFRATASSRLRV